MPAENRNKGIAQRFRKNPIQRMQKQGTLCKNGTGRRAHSTPCCIPSFSTLNLKPIKGIEITFKHNDEEEINQLKQIFDVLWHTYKIIAKDKKPKNPFKDVLPIIDVVTTQLLGMIKEVIPEKADINIEYDDYDKTYTVVIYQRCPFDEGLQTFDIHSVVTKLKRYNPRLLEMFYVFLKSFSKSLNIDLWFHAIFDNEAMDRTEEELEDFDIEDADSFMREVFDYKHGYIAHAENEIKNSNNLDWEGIAWHLERFNFDKKHPIVQLILKGCELMKDCYPTHKFDYFPEFHIDDWFGLRFPNQMVIFYSLNDLLTQKSMEYIDASGYEGVAEPNAFEAFSLKKNEFKGFDDWQDRIEFPMKLCKFFDFANEQIQTFTKKTYK